MNEYLISGFLDGIEKNARTLKTKAKRVGLGLAELSAAIPIGMAVQQKVSIPVAGKLIGSFINQGFDLDEALLKASITGDRLGNIAGGAAAALTAALIKRLARPMMKDVIREKATIQKQRIDKLVKSLE